MVPLYNEEESIRQVTDKIVQACSHFEFVWEIVFVDDGSTDRTWQLIEQLKSSVDNLHAVKFRKNYGQTSAMVAGFEYARGEIIVTMDGDLQNDPSDIPKLIRKN